MIKRICLVFINVGIWSIICFVLGLISGEILGWTLAGIAAGLLIVWVSESVFLALEIA
jgi:hypothetical protein